MSTLFVNLDVKDFNGSPLFSLSSSNLHLGGSADVDLMDRIKSPDFSLYGNHPQKKPLMKAWPTVVWEVVYSQNERKLTNDLWRHVACSLGRVRLAIGVNIEHNHAVKGQPHSLKTVTCIFWEVDPVEEFVMLEALRSPLNRLMRCDHFAKNGNDSVLPAPTRFSCVSEVRGRYMKFFVSQWKLYKASCDDLNSLAFVLISRFRHRLFRKILLGPHPCPSYTNTSIAL